MSCVNYFILSTSSFNILYQIVCDRFSQYFHKNLVFCDIPTPNEIIWNSPGVQIKEAMVSTNCEVDIGHRSTNHGIELSEMSIHSWLIANNVEWSGFIALYDTIRKLFNNCARETNNDCLREYRLLHLKHSWNWKTKRRHELKFSSSFH